MSNPPDRLLLLDASNYIFRAYHATSARSGFESTLTTSAGMPVNAVLVFTNMLRKLIRDLKPTHFACVFDAPGAKATRQAEYAEYKKNRAETPPDLVVQLPYMRPIAKALGVTLIEEPGIEADDLIATLAKQAGAQGVDAVMVSSDKDLYQLLDHGVRLYDGMKDKWIDAAACIEK
ncbi:MAG: DNA polymerase I, partial [Myxococcales bacterium]|nr:DNA polymerase I [Myxococcales bacterium]